MVVFLLLLILACLVFPSLVTILSCLAIPIGFFLLFVLVLAVMSDKEK